jgi:hypothetical protein
MALSQLYTLHSTDWNEKMIMNSEEGLEEDGRGLFHCTIPAFAAGTVTWTHYFLHRNASLQFLLDITNSMEQINWEANCHSANQEIPLLVWNPKVHYLVHKSPLLVPVLRQMNVVHILPTYFTRIHSNIILSSTYTSSEWSVLFRFSK